MSEIKEVLYKDFPISFSAHPVTGNLSILKNADAVKQSVKNIVLTNFYERPYAPLLGGNVRAQMFENMVRAMTVAETHPVIDRTFSMEQCREAFSLMEQVFKMITSASSSEDAGT